MKKTILIIIVSILILALTSCNFPQSTGGALNTSAPARTDAPAITPTENSRIPESMFLLSRASSTQRWEYTISAINPYDLEGRSTARLNELGAEGWILIDYEITDVHYGGNANAYAIFIRPLN